MHHWLTFSRLWLAAAFCVGVAVFARPGRFTATAMAVLLLVGIAEELTDMLDGIVARRAGAASELGGLFDPLADSLARLAIYFALAIAGWVTIAVPLVMTARDILVAYSRILQARVGGKTSARVAGKIKAWVQGTGFLLLVVLSWLSGSDLAATANTARQIISAVLIAVTAWSAWSYLHGAWPAARQLARPRPSARDEVK